MSPHPRDPGALQQALNQALGAQDWQTAETLLADMAALIPDNPSVFYNRALVRRRMGAVENALGDLGQALSLDPTHRNALFERASLELEQGWWERAAESFTAYLTAMPEDSDARLNLANLLLRLNRPQEALAEADKAHEADMSVLTILALAECRRDCGDVDGMEAALATLPDDDPAFAAAKLSLRTQGAQGRISLSACP